MIELRVRRLLLWVLLPVVLLLLLYAGLGFLAVPRLLRSGVQGYVSEHYHRSVALGVIRFNPFTLRLDVSDFALPDSDGQPMIAFRHLLVDLTVASLWRLGPDFEAIVLEQPYVRALIRPDGRLNLQDLAPEQKPSPQPSSGPGRLFINHFSVQGGSVAFEDRAHPSVFRAEIKPINFDLRDFSTVGSEAGTYSLSATSEAGEHFKWAGSLAARPLSSHGQFEVGNLQARTLWNYVRDSVHFELPSGAISLHGDYNFTAATAPVGLSVNVHDLTMSDLALRPKGGNEDYVKLGKVEVQETRADLASRSVTVGNVHLAGGTIRAWLESGGNLNLMELSAGPAGTQGSAAAPTMPSPTSASPTAASPSAPMAPAPAALGNAPDAWQVSVPDVQVDGLQLSAQDRQVTPAASMELEGLSLHVTGFRLPRASPLTVTLSTQVNHDGKVEGKAEVGADSSIKLHSEVAQLDLTPLQPYITQHTALTLRSGLLSAKLNIDRGADGKLSADGDAELSRVRTVDNALKQDFIKFERLQLSGIDFKSDPRSLRVHSILARAPYARVIIESDRTVNVSKVLMLKSASKPAGGEPPADSGSAAPTTAEATASVLDTQPASQSSQSGAPPTEGTSNAAPVPANPAAMSASSRRHRHAPKAGSESSAAPSQMALAIDTVRIQNGSANYADYWIQPHFAVGIQTLQGTITGLSSDPRSRAKVELQGKVDRYAPVHIWGAVNPLAATAYSDLNMSFKGVELSSVTPYSGHFAGYKIEKGKLSVDISYKIENRQLTAQHRFVINQLELGDRVESPDAVKLPLKIAVALLKDRNGVIDVNLPVSGSLDNPQFSLGPLIWKAVLGLLTKVATAPFAALGHLFGGGGAEMKYVDFSPGSASLDPHERDKLTALAKALKEKTQLALDVPMTYSPELDRPGLALARLDRRLLALVQQGTGSSRSKSPASPGDEKPDPAASAPTDPALSDPGARFHLLVALYHQELGKDAALPDSAQAIVAAEKKKAPPPDFGPANLELQSALLPRMEVSDNQLEALGRRRAQAIQDALLSGGDVDPSRVFIIGNNSKSDSKDKVRIELSLK